MPTDSRFQAFTRTHQHRADEAAVILALLLAGDGRESNRGRANNNRPKRPLMPRGGREAAARRVYPPPLRALTADER